MTKSRRAGLGSVRLTRCATKKISPIEGKQSWVRVSQQAVDTNIAA
jgi:hypothetical protein